MVKTNAERQAAYRQRRKDELDRLRSGGIDWKPLLRAVDELYDRKATYTSWKNRIKAEIEAIQKR